MSAASRPPRIPWPLYGALHIIAILFVSSRGKVFLYPGAVRTRKSLFGVTEFAVVLAFLIVGYILGYMKGALEGV